MRQPREHAFIPGNHHHLKHHLPMKAFFLLISCLFLTALSIAQPGETGLVRIDVNRPGPAGTAAEMLRVTGFTLLQDDSGMDENHAPTQILFAGDVIYLLENHRLDGKETLNFFHWKTGKLIRSIALGGYDRSGYIDHMGLAFRPDGQGITVLGGEGVRYFDWNGVETGEQVTGIYGYDLAYADTGALAFFTLYTPSETSGPYHVSIVDGRGQLKTRLAPFPPSRRMGVSHTGFLSRSDNKVWFSPPFGDTVYQLAAGQEMTARYHLNFDGREIPRIDRLADRNLSFDEWSETAFMGRRWVRSSDLVFFTFHNGPNRHTGVYQESTRRLATTERAPEGDPMAKLLRTAAYFSEKDPAAVAFLIVPSVAGHYLNKWPGLAEDLNGLYPGLGDAYTQAAADHVPLIVYLSAK
jgi:hypothetical protein